MGIAAMPSRWRQIRYSGVPAEAAGMGFKIKSNGTAILASRLTKRRDGDVELRRGSLDA
jgi:hypothetical protein